MAALKRLAKQIEDEAALASRAGQHDRLMKIAAEISGLRCEHGAHGRGGEEVGVMTEAWPEAVSDGLTLACADCGQVPRFDYRVTEEFWAKHVTGLEQLGVICLPCLDRRCGGAGLAESLVEMQWTGTGHTVVLMPTARYVWPRR